MLRRGHTTREASISVSYSVNVNPGVDLEVYNVKDQLKSVIDYFYKSEEAYVNRGLRICVQGFFLPLAKRCELDDVDELISSQHVKAIFQDYEQLFDLNERLFSSLTNIRLEGIQEFLEGVGECLLEYIPFFRMYANYIKDYKSCVKNFKNILKTKQKFAEFCRIGEECYGHDLVYFLKLPVRRLPQYLTFLGLIYDSVPDKNTGYAVQLERSIMDLKSVADEIIQKIQKNEASAHVMRLMNNIFGGKPADLIKPHRFVVKHSKMLFVLPKKKAKKYHFILFNDLLIYGTRVKMGIGGVKGTHEAIGMRAESLPLNMGLEASLRFQCKVSVADGTEIVFAAKNYDSQIEWADAITKTAIECEEARTRRKLVRAISGDHHPQLAPSPPQSPQRKSPNNVNAKPKAGKTVRIKENLDLLGLESKDSETEQRIKEIQFDAEQRIKLAQSEANRKVAELEKKFKEHMKAQIKKKEQKTKQKLKELEGIELEARQKEKDLLAQQESMKAKEEEAQVRLQRELDELKNKKNDAQLAQQELDKQIEETRKKQDAAEEEIKIAQQKQQKAKYAEQNAQEEARLRILRMQKALETETKQETDRIVAERNVKEAESRRQIQLAEIRAKNEAERRKKEAEKLEAERKRLLKERRKKEEEIKKKSEELEKKARWAEKRANLAEQEAAEARSRITSLGAQQAQQVLIYSQMNAPSGVNGTPSGLAVPPAALAALPQNGNIPPAAAAATPAGSGSGSGSDTSRAAVLSAIQNFDKSKLAKNKGVSGSPAAALDVSMDPLRDRVTSVGAISQTIRSLSRRQQSIDGMSSILGDSLAKYRNIVEASDDEEDSDDDWN